MGSPAANGTTAAAIVGSGRCRSSISLLVWLAAGRAYACQHMIACPCFTGCHLPGMLTEAPAAMPGNNGSITQAKGECCFHTCLDSVCCPAACCIAAWLMLQGTMGAPLKRATRWVPVTGCIGSHPPATGHSTACAQCQTSMQRTCSMQMYNAVVASSFEVQGPAAFIAWLPYAEAPRMCPN
jgi:hypothetical protein